MAQTEPSQEHGNDTSGRHGGADRRDGSGRASASSPSWWTHLWTRPLERPPVRTTLIQLGALSIAAGIAALLDAPLLFTGFAYGAAAAITFLPPFPYRTGRHSLAALLFLIAAGLPIFWCGTAISR